MPKRKPLSYYLSRRYPFRVQVDDDAGYVVEFPDLPGLFTGAERLEDLPRMIEEARTLWMEGVYEDGMTIPEPTQFDDDVYSGKFNLRLPKDLHRNLAEGAEKSGVSLNQHVMALLSAGDALSRIERRIDDLERAINATEGSGKRVADERATYRTKPARKQAKSRKRAS